MISYGFIEQRANFPDRTPPPFDPIAPDGGIRSHNIILLTLSLSVNNMTFPLPGQLDSYGNIP